MEEAALIARYVNEDLVLRPGYSERAPVSIATFMPPPPRPICQDWIRTEGWNGAGSKALRVGAQLAEKIGIAQLGILRLV